MEHWRNYIDRRKPNYPKNTQPQYHFVHHKFLGLGSNTALCVDMVQWCSPSTCDDEMSFRIASTYS